MGHQMTYQVMYNKTTDIVRCRYILDGADDDAICIDMSWEDYVNMATKNIEIVLDIKDYRKRYQDWVNEEALSEALSILGGSSANTFHG